MFSSVSGCAPNSRIRLEFVSTKNQSFDITNEVLLYVNGNLILSRPTTISSDDYVEIELDTPTGFLSHRFYDYILDDLKHTFAVVNQNDYRPPLKEADAPRKWFNYFPRQIRTSFYDEGGTKSKLLGFGRDLVDIDATHVVLDHIKEAVSFFSSKRELVTTVKLPSGPIEYKKSTYIDNNSETRVELYVVCNDRRMYRIRFDNRYSSTNQFVPTVTYIRSLELMWYEADLPTGESYIDNRRNTLREKVNPLVTALDIFGNTIWVGGYDTIYILNKNFQILRTVLIGTESIFAITCMDEQNAYAVTRNGNIWHITSSGDYTKIYQGDRPLGFPALYTDNQGNKSVLVPDPNYQRLLKITTPAAPNLSLSWPTPGYSPAYARNFEGDIFVTSHDSNVVLRFKNQGTLVEYEFNEKVTVASWATDDYASTLLGVHYLKNYVTLDLTGIQKAIRVPKINLKGPLTQIGSHMHQLTMLGQEGISVKTPTEVTAWINGIRNEPASTGDNFGISYQALEPGFFRTAFVIGDRAYDVDVEVINDEKYLDSFKSSVVSVNRLSTLSNTSFISTPTLGNIQSGLTTVNLGFNLNFFGNSYSTVRVSTNGYLSFGDSQVNQVPTDVGSLNIDALYVEPKDLYQGLPLDNTDPSNITFKPLPSGLTPGVTVESGNYLDYYYSRIRWAGSSGIPDPLGIRYNLPVTITNSFNIPSENLFLANIGDYVSGTGITQTTKVVSRSFTPTYEFTAYRIININEVLVTSYLNSVLQVPRYSRVNQTNNYVLASNRVVISSSLSRGNYLLLVDGNRIVVDDTVDSAVNNNWAIRLPVSGSIFNFVYQTGITSINTVTELITCIGVPVSLDPNVTVSPFEFYVSSDDYNKVYVYQKLNNAPVSVLYVTDKTFDGNNYVITTNIVHNLTANDVVYATSTTITSASNMPSLNDGVLLEQKVEFEYSSLTLTAFVSLGYITTRASFIVTDRQITSVVGTTLTFKEDLPVEEYTYEVGFYQNNRFQFIEYYYDNTFHDGNANVGLATGTKTLGSRIIKSQVPAGTSIVYYSENGSGVFRELGLGSFDFTSKFVPLAPKIFKAPIKSSLEQAIEFYVEQDIVSNSNIYIASTFGDLRVNGGLYDAWAPIKTGDLVQLTLAFNKSYRPVAPIISIDTVQFPIPMVVEPAEPNLTKHMFLFENEITNTYVSKSITIPATDYYYIPNLYRSSGGFFPDFTYRLIRNGNQTDLTSDRYYDLFAGDIVVFGNILTSAAIYDYRDVVIIGQSNSITVRVKTQGPALVNYLDFGILTEPYTNNYTYNTVTTATDIYLDIDEDYRSANLLLTSNSSITSANLYIGEVQTDLIINGNVVGNYVKNVAIGSNVALLRDVIDYFQSNVTIYQVEYDAAAASNVFIEVGNWAIEERNISDNAVSTKPSMFSVQTSSLFDRSQILDIGRVITPDTTPPSVFELGIITSYSTQPINYFNGRLTYLLSNKPYAISGLRMTPISGKTYSYLTKQINMVFSKPTQFLDGRIVSQSYNDFTYIKSSAILGSYVTAVTRFTDIIKGKYQGLQTELYIGSVDGFREETSLFLPTASIGTLIDNFSVSLADKYNSEFLVRETEFRDQFDWVGFENFVLYNSYIETPMYPGAIPNFCYIESEYGEVKKWDEGNFGVFLSMESSRENPFNVFYNEHISNKEELIALNYYEFDQKKLESQTYLNADISEDLEVRFTDFSGFHYARTYKAIQEIWLKTQSQYETAHNYYYYQHGSLVETRVNEIWSSVQAEVPIRINEFWFGNQYVIPKDIVEVWLKNDFLVNIDYNEFILNIGIETGSTNYQFNPIFDFRLLTQFRDFRFMPGIETPYYNEIKSEFNRAELYDDLNLLMFSNKLELDYENEIFISLDPVVNTFNEIIIPFEPLRDLPPVYMLPLTPVLMYTPFEMIVPLTTMIDIIPHRIIPFEPYLYQEVIWKMNKIITEVGAYKTFMHHWVDQGRYNDKWNLRDFGPTNYTRAYEPLVVYSKNYNYLPGGFINDGQAEDEKVKYYNAIILQVPGSDFWNYRIYFKDRHFCVPKKGRIFPVTWYIRGG